MVLVTMCCVFIIGANSIVCRKKSQVTPPRTEKILFFGGAIAELFLTSACNCRIIVYTSTLIFEGIDWLQRIGFRGGTTIYVAHGHHPSADSGLSLANDKRARLSVVSPRLGQQPARLASQRHTPLHVGAQLTAQSTGWQASALILSLCRQEMVRRFLQTHRYPSGSTRGEVEKILRNRGWGPRNDLPDDGGGDIGHDVKAGRQAKTGRAGLGLQPGLRAIQNGPQSRQGEQGVRSAPKCCRVARVDTCRAVDGSTVPKLGYARLPILCLCLGRVTHAGQSDARLCVLVLGARPGASLGHSDGRQDYDARRKSAAVIEIILLVASLSRSA